MAGKNPCQLAQTSSQKKCIFQEKGTFTNYVDKTKWVGGTGNVNSMQIFPCKRKGIPLQMSTQDWLSKQAKILSTQLKNAPKEDQKTFKIELLMKELEEQEVKKIKFVIASP